MKSNQPLAGPDGSARAATSIAATSRAATIVTAANEAASNRAATNMGEPDAGPLHQLLGSNGDSE